MKQAQRAYDEHFSTRARIRELGEVFTPTAHVERLTTLFDAAVWSDEDALFFEPSAGRGNITMAILTKRVDTLLAQQRGAPSDEALQRALANSLHTLWAIDICPDNVRTTRTRILQYVVEVLGLSSSLTAADKIDFLTHALCTLVWQISQNEALSALGAPPGATTLGRAWVARHGAQRLAFHRPWATLFVAPRPSPRVRSLYRQAERIVHGAARGQTVTCSQDFAFAQPALAVAFALPR